VPTRKVVTVSILGDIYEAGVIDISLKVPQAVRASKKRKMNGKAVDVVTDGIGTRTEHYLAYLPNVTDVLNKKLCKAITW
jgi:hypothetical protein